MEESEDDDDSSSEDDEITFVGFGSNKATATVPEVRSPGAIADSFFSARNVAARTDTSDLLDELFTLTLPQVYPTAETPLPQPKPDEAVTAILDELHSRIRPADPEPEPPMPPLPVAPATDSASPPSPLPTPSRAEDAPSSAHLDAKRERLLELRRENERLQEQLAAMRHSSTTPTPVASAIPSP